MFQKKTIDSVLAVAKSVVEDLNTLCAEHQAAAARIDEERTRTKIKADEHSAESVRAARLADKWGELV